MPNEYARSGFHSGETASGYFDEAFTVHIAGTNRTSKCRFESLTIRETDDDTPNTFDGVVHGFTPSEAQEVKVYNGGVDVGVPLFVGHILHVAGQSARKADRVTHAVHAVDPRWLIDRYALVSKRYLNKGVGTIVADILANYTDGGFTLGYCPMSLGNIDDITFTNERVTECLARLAKMVGGTARVYYTKRVSIAVTHDDEDNALTLTDSTTEHWDVRSAADLSQIRTRVIYEGQSVPLAMDTPAGEHTIVIDDRGATLEPFNGFIRIRSELYQYADYDALGEGITTEGRDIVASDVAVGATTIPVFETTPFFLGLAGHGWLLIDGQYIAYTGTDPTSGPGNITGIPSAGPGSVKAAIATGTSVQSAAILESLWETDLSDPKPTAEDLVAGELVFLYAQVDDAAAQTALATLLGGGLSGIVTHYVQDGRLSVPECVARATADLERFSAALKSLQYTTTNPYNRPGRTVSVNITKPQTINETLQIQTMTLQGRHLAHNVTALEFDRLVTIAPRERQLPDVIATGISGAGA